MFRIALALLAWPLAFTQARLLNASTAEKDTPGRVVSDMMVGIGNATWSGTPRIVSWHPMAVVYDNFLTEEECDYILKLSKPRMEPAMIVDSEAQKHHRSKSRTSHGAFFDTFEDEILAMISNRIAHVAKVPPENLEPWQVMKYGPSEEYTRHVDYYKSEERFFGNDMEKFGGIRIKTALLYLTSATGGETVFPKALQPNDVGAASCAHRGAGVECKKGAMLLFNDILPNGENDLLTSHQSCPVITGEKVVVSRFIREEHCHLNRFFTWRKWNGNVFCEDDHTRCAEWAAQGHCTTSDIDLRERMIGDEDWTGFCEKTCRFCRPLEDTVVQLRKELGQELPPEAIAGRLMGEDEVEELYS